MKLLYIAGPFSAVDIHGVERYIIIASVIALEAWRKGWAVICPHKNTSGFQYAGLPDEVWYQGDIEILSRCDAILLMPGWKTSAGAYDEALYAGKKGLDIYDFETQGIPVPKNLRSIKIDKLIDNDRIKIDDVVYLKFPASARFGAGKHRVLRVSGYKVCISVLNSYAWVSRNDLIKRE